MSEHDDETWNYQRAGNDYDYLVYKESDGKNLAIVVDGGEAAARLIAAAPKLLAAVKELLPMWDSGIVEPHVTRARQALAEATDDTSRI